MQDVYVPSSPWPLPAACPARWTHEDAVAPRWSPSHNVCTPLHHLTSTALLKPGWVKHSGYLVHFQHHIHSNRNGVWELLGACVCRFLGCYCGVFFTCCLHGDDKLHVNVFVPSGSDESDCTPGILFVCRSVCVCFCVSQWEWWPTCYCSHSDQGVLYN